LSVITDSLQKLVYCIYEYKSLKMVCNFAYLPRCCF